MRFRPGAEILFWLLEVALIGVHYGFPELPHLIGLTLFWAGVIGLVLWGLAHLGAFDRFPFIAKLLGPPPEPVRDLEVDKAIAYVCFRQWGHSFQDAAGSRSADAVAGLRSFQQAAADGKVKIWGKAHHSNVFEPIPQEYWLKYQIEWFGLLRSRPTTEPAVIGVSRGSEYAELMTSKSQIEAIWPKKRKKLRLQSPVTFKDA
jgi:hypothetical protein